MSTTPETTMGDMKALAEKLIALAAKATEGPWAVNPFLAQVDALSGLEPLAVCQMLWPTDQCTEEETQANAELIAALPWAVAIARAYLDTAPSPALALAQEALRPQSDLIFEITREGHLDGFFLRVASTHANGEARAAELAADMRQYLAPDVTLTTRTESSRFAAAPADRERMEAERAVIEAAAKCRSEMIAMAVAAANAGPKGIAPINYMSEPQKALHEALQKLGRLRLTHQDSAGSERKD